MINVLDFFYHKYFVNFERNFSYFSVQFSGLLLFAPFLKYRVFVLCDNEE